MIEHDDRTSFSKYYTPKDEKKRLQFVDSWKNVFDMSERNKG